MAAHPDITWSSEQAARLSELFPDWDIWFVPVYLGPDAWCAKPKGSPIATINAHSPDELEFEIREQP